MTAWSSLFLNIEQGSALKCKIWKPLGCKDLNQYVKQQQQQNSKQTKTKQTNRQTKMCTKKPTQTGECRHAVITTNTN